MSFKDSRTSYDHKTKRITIFSIQNARRTGKLSFKIKEDTEGQSGKDGGRWFHRSGAAESFQFYSGNSQEVPKLSKVDGRNI